MADMPPVQSRLLTIVAALSPSFGAGRESLVIAGQAAVKRQTAVGPLRHRFGIGVNALVPGVCWMISMSMPRVAACSTTYLWQPPSLQTLRIEEWAAVTWSSSWVPAGESWMQASGPTGYEGGSAPPARSEQVLGTQHMVSCSCSGRSRSVTRPPGHRRSQLPGLLGASRQGVQARDSG